MPPFDDDVDETPTPVVSASYALFQSEADRIADELDRAAALWSRRLDMIDPRSAAKARDFAGALRTISARFGRWPHLPGEVVARERSTLVAEFFRLVDDAIRHVETLPTHPALGKPRRHR